MDAGTRHYTAWMTDFDSSGSFLAVINSHRKVEVFRYDSNLNQIGYRRLIYNRGRKRENLIRISSVGDSLRLIVHRMLASNTTGIYAINVDRELRVSETLLARIEHRNGFYPSLHFRTGDHENYVWYQDDRNQNMNETVILCHQYDSSWHLSGSDTIRLDIPVRLFAVMNVEVERLGKYVIFGKVYKGNQREKRGGKANSRYVVSVVEQSDDFHSVRPFFLTSDSLYNRSLRYSRKGADLQYLSIWSDQDPDHMKGVEYGKVDLNVSGSGSSIMVTLPDSIIYLDNTIAGQTISDPSIRDFYLKNYWFDQGKLHFVLEKHYISSTGSSAGKTLYDYYYLDMMYGVYDTTRKVVERLHVIPKFQKTFNDDGNFSSTRIVVNSDSVTFYYNVHPKHFSKKRKMRNSHKSALAYTSINQYDYSVRSGLIQNNKQVKKVPMIRSVRPVGENRYLGLATWMSGVYPFYFTLD